MRRALRQPLMPSAAPRLPDTAPPALGADTRAILAEIGYADDDIAALVAEKAVGAGEPSG
jgi:crotonobetainyl-CoA:carnitine CoA-transferase CaiB-like acyl-CoA transferase